MLDPFNCDVSSAEVEIQEELIELRCNENSKYMYDKAGKTEFLSLKDCKILYPRLLTEMAKIIGQYILVETGFSSVNKLLTKERNRLDV